MKMGLGLCVGAGLLCQHGHAQTAVTNPNGNPEFVPHTLKDALALTYLTNPQLREARAQLRSVDEQMSAAEAGWRPTITANGSLTYYKGSSRYTQQTEINGQTVRLPNIQHYNSGGYNTTVSLTQPIYQGGKTVASIHMARNQIFAQRARLIETEQEVLYGAMNAYVRLVANLQLLQVSINNERALRAQLDAANRRFRLGELSRTDVAQAQGALATATAERHQTEGAVQAAQASYLQVVGVPAPPDLVPPQPLALPVRTEQEAVAEAVRNNPNVIAALFNEAQQKDNISLQMSAIMPKLSAGVAYQRSKDQGQDQSLQDNKYATLNLQIPLYQGGSEYAAVRQARQTAIAARNEVDVQRRSALEQTSESWQTYMSIKDTLRSHQIAVSSNMAALAGVERQALVGTATTLSVLQQQATLLQSQRALIQSVTSLVTSSYDIARAMGHLTAVDLKLNVPLYDEKAYYHAVKNRLWGVGDYQVNQPGR
ncbi:secretion protein [Parasaccharibacter sp. TMW2.1882]|uniref:Secretion protein n=2 Tax=Acetobacteraceae TaxID=433 RepID=A0ABX4ZP79_9PROT|nr:MULTISPECIES: TolC family outer membrane protein [Acetobacteraceae]MCL1562689.1 secretion protein [Parasaccharibacter sp. TMW 2.1886]MCQ0041255.1 TolC family outer membrane protein [Bombella sp.]MUG79431.1 TolC family outer membrane protein [Bombella sp. ESL0380]MUH02733.1 TolC family outer membrane protein [Bombella sp. ESL0387]QGT75094.1 TolC family outer membrane protein [Bombella sp. ESL0368]